MASQATAGDHAPGQELRDCLRRFDAVATSDPDTSEALLQLEGSLQAGLVLEELGHACSVDATHCKRLLSFFLPLNEKDVAQIIGLVSRTHLGVEDVHGAYATVFSVLCDSPSYVGDSPWLSTWNQDVLIDTLKELAPALDWRLVIENLDHEGFFVPDQQALSVLMSFFTRNSQDTFPIQAVCGRIWKNTEGQLSFLRHAAVAPPEIFTFASSHRKQVMLFYILFLLNFLFLFLFFLKMLLEGYHRFAFGSPNHAWLSMDLLETLCRLAELGHGEAVRSLLEYPAKHCPELLLTGLAQLKTDWNLVQNEYFTPLFSAYLGINQHASLVMHQLWLLSRELMKKAMVEIHSKEPSAIGRILDVCQELKVLSEVLDGTPFQFSIDLAALAGRREFLNLEKWLHDNLVVYQEPLFQACLSFLRERLLVESFNGQSGTPRSGPIGLSMETTAIFFKVLQAFSAQLSSRELVEEMRRVHAAAIRANPRLLSGAGTEQSSSEAFSSDVEEEANVYFQKIYKGQLTIENVVEMLERLNGSSVPREHEVFSCMIHSLFDEYRFFPRYPERELKITAVLFGKLISHQLVSSITLGVALRCVLDSLRKTPDSKMFSFGMTALEQFRSRLEEWPQYCNHILQISHMRDGHMDLVDYIERSLARASSTQTDVLANPSSDQQNAQVQPELDAAQNLNPQQQEERSAGGTLVANKPLSQSVSSTAQLYEILKGQQKAMNAQQSSSHFSKPARTMSVPGRHVTTPGFGHALNIETLVAAAERRDPIENPSLETEDKVAFIINNISVANYEAKAKECLEVLKDKYYPWFAQYMVMKRASIEPNFHDIYLKVLDKMNSRALDQEIVNATYQNCKVLLGSELIKSSSEERSLLKNLGSWLGKLTIGRNKVLKAKEIDPKTLITEAYERGLMIAVIPFTSKILEPCQTSQVYQPPNPWTMGILGLLSEIYALPNLKMNLKFDIEVLFKHLGVEMKDVKQTQLVKGRMREVEGNPDFSNKELIAATHPPATTEHSIISNLNQVEFLPELPAHPVPHATATQLPVHVSPNASQDEEKVLPFVGERVKAHSTAPSPFSSGQASTLSNLNVYVVLNNRLAGISQQHQQQMHRIIPLAMERAIREIIAPVVDRSVTIACMTTRELIQKDYALEADDNRTLHSSNLMVASLAGSLAHVTCKEPLRVAMASHIRNALQPSISSDVLEQTVHVVTNDNLDLGCAVIEKAATEKALRDLEDSMAPILIARRTQRDVVHQAYTQGNLSRLPESLRPKAGRLSPAQQRVFEDFARLPWQTQASAASTRPNYPNVFPSHTSTAITQASDVNADEVDVRTQSPTSFPDGGARHQEVLSSDGTSALLPDGSGAELLKLHVPNILPGPTLPTEPPGPVSRPVKDDVKPIPRDTDPVGLRDQIALLFDEWARVCNTPGANDKTYANFISQLTQSGFLKGDDVTDQFFRILTELAVAHSLSVESSPIGTLNFAAVDLYAKLVVLLVKFYAAESTANKVGLLNRVLNVTVRVIQKDADEKKTSFQPRPYFRLFLTWLMDFNAPDPSLDSSVYQILLSFTNALTMLQPLNTPGWSFVWLELISHRTFMPKQLLVQQPKGWPNFQRLLVSLFRFMDPYLRSAELSDPIRLLYKGTLRVLLVLLHDFPEFLCDYHFSFCDVIPPSCIQMRNLILSAFPRNMRLPDPFTPNLKVDLLPEISHPPRILSDVEAALKSKQLKGDVDEYLKTRLSPPLFLVDLKQRLLLSQHESGLSGTRYNVPLINSLVLYVGMQAIQQLQAKTAPQIGVPTAPITHSAPMDIFQKLIVELDTEGRYLFLNAIANQLRYPNNHTHYFSCVLLYLFAEASQEIIQEQITRVLLERLIVNRPHPWGLLITFIELIKNPRYNFWNHAFVRCAPEIDRLFESVARSCMGPPAKPTDEEINASLSAEAIKG
ncbi:CCR4-NOT transcription complex subunit 1 isoform X1 [Selaginella moellendorffii]|uniref:CCR4-NOT transcription complex subunit 1 isoform X1 n=1 Tax=Selaginella moellendorffii TaxID=88036 RepID=UPI000D1C6D4B|nr:CCR4-NOT transcription complex subunit 1 isoform X1 [Selaginella moellendorffii]|eukprot:XP_024528197.1 CCR4-NOT transcription complex subunit 1 isoform X1 [Selaginella moellendorffii]